MRVLLVNPPHLRLGGGSCSWIGVGLMYVAQSLLEHGHEVKIYNSDKRDRNIVLSDKYYYFELDKVFEQNYNSEYFLDEIVKNILDFNPDVVGFYVYSINIRYVEKIIKRLRQLSKVRIIGGGVHFRYAPKSYNISGLFDAVCVTEGEDVVENMLYVNGVHSSDTIDINRVIKKDIFFENDYDCLMSIEAVRGCPYNCVFCQTGNFTDKKKVKRDIDIVVEEIEYRKSLGIKRFIFSDELIDVKYFRELGNRVSGIELAIETRVDAVNDEKMKILKDLGCLIVKYGIESGSDKQLKIYNKQFGLRDIERAVELTKKYGIMAQGNCVIGCPDSTEEDYNDSYEFFKKLDLDWVSSSILVPFPGTKLFDNVKDKLTPNLRDYMFSGRFANEEWYRFWNITRENLEKFSSLNDNKVHYHDRGKE